MNDLSVAISIIVAIAAIISPILTTVINNSHQKKMKKLELDQEHYEKSITYQKEIFESYLRRAGACIGSSCSILDDLKSYKESYLAALLYAPDDLRELMKKTNKSIESFNEDVATVEFEKLIPKIQEHINKL